jgi:uncharacterized protein YaaR (DUF327 family)
MYRYLQKEKERLLRTDSICKILEQEAKKSQYVKCGLCFGVFPEIFFNCELRHLDPTRETNIWQKIKVIDEKLDQLNLSFFDKLLLKIR